MVIEAVVKTLKLQVYAMRNTFLKLENNGKHIT
jgi:hypothetical protein